MPPSLLYPRRGSRLGEGPWCKWSGFVAIMAIVALNCGAVLISYTTYR